VYPSDSPDQLKFKVKHSDASVAICEGKAEFDKIKSVIDGIPYLKAIVVWAYDEAAGTIARKDGSKVRVATFNQMKELGSKASDASLEERTKAMKPSHCCTLVYTRYVCFFTPQTRPAQPTPATQTYVHCFCSVNCFSCSASVHTYILTDTSRSDPPNIQTTPVELLASQRPLC
jgi:hypothetical protein